MAISSFTARRLHHLHRGSVLTLILVLGLALAGIGPVGLAGPVGVASAQTPITGCTTIDEPGAYELTQNITNADPADGACIHIQTSHVVVDGNGFTIDGTNTGFDIGVSVIAGSPRTGVTPLTNVTVQNLTLTDWGDAIIYNQVSGGAIHDITAQNNYDGIGLAAITNTTITNNTVQNNTGDGITLSATGRFTGSYSNTITNNIITQNAGAGINLRSGSEANTVANNTITQNNGTGISLSDSVNNRITTNIVQKNGEGIALFDGDANRITNNIITQNTGHGIDLPHSSRNTITNNTIAQNTHYGIRLSDSVNNTITNNTIAQNTEAGIRHAFNSDSNLLYNNWLNNTNNVDIRGAGTDTWNVSRQPGPNIIGGPFLGGNYYATPNGTGYSQTCSDANGDGFCDHPNDLGGDNPNIDSLPLTAQRPPNNSVSPSTVEFGTVTVGNTTTATVTVTNTGGSPLTVTATAITGPNASAFTVTNGSAPPAFTLGPGENKTLTIQFAPASRGEKTATVRVESAAADTLATGGLSGRGRCPGDRRLTGPD